MLRLVDRYLKKKHVSRYGSLGIVLSRYSLDWHFMILDKGDLTVQATGQEALSGGADSACQAIAALMNRPELSRALVTVALANDICRFMVARFEHLPHSEKDREPYMRWSYEKRFNSAGTPRRRSSHIKVKLLCGREQQVPYHVAIADPTEYAEGVIAFLSESSFPTGSILPLAAAYGSSVCSLQPQLKDGLLLIVDKNDWHYFWWSDGALVFYRSQHWLASLDRSHELLAQDIKSLYLKMGGSRQNTQALLLVHNEEMYAKLPEGIKDLMGNTYRPHNWLGIETPSTEYYSASFWVASMELKAG